MEEIKVGTKIKWKETGKTYKVISITLYIGVSLEWSRLLLLSDGGQKCTIASSNLNQMWRDNKCEIVAD